MKKVYPLSLVADYFIALAHLTGTFLSNLKLQKLVYYAQAWTLVELKRELIEEDFQAWIRGPVIPSLYEEYSKFSCYSIRRDDLRNSFEKIEKEFEPEIQKLLGMIDREYFSCETYYLEMLTNHEDPWVITRAGLHQDMNSDRIIPKELMIKYYSKFLEELENEEEKPIEKS